LQHDTYSTGANDIDIFVTGGTNHQLHARGVEWKNGYRIEIMYGRTLGKREARCLGQYGRYRKMRMTRIFGLSLFKIVVGDLLRLKILFGSVPW
jgi:hypothetical protein